jgi:hypothetical protein
MTLPDLAQQDVRILRESTKSLVRRFGVSKSRVYALRKQHHIICHKAGYDWLEHWSAQMQQAMDRYEERFMREEAKKVIQWHRGEPVEGLPKRIQERIREG